MWQTGSQTDQTLVAGAAERSDLLSERTKPLLCCFWKHCMSVWGHNPLSSIFILATIKSAAQQMRQGDLLVCGCPQTSCDFCPHCCRAAGWVSASPGEAETTPSAPLLYWLPKLITAHRSICVYWLKEACVLHQGVAGKALQPCEVIWKCCYFSLAGWNKPSASKFFNFLFRFVSSPLCNALQSRFPSVVLH